MLAMLTGRRLYTRPLMEHEGASLICTSPEYEKTPQGLSANEIVIFRYLDLSALQTMMAIRTLSVLLDQRITMPMQGSQFVFVHRHCFQPRWCQLASSPMTHFTLLKASNIPYISNKDKRPQKGRLWIAF